MSLRDALTGALVMAPMTKGSNLPYRRLCTELGARVLVSEMTVARRLKQKRRSEFALIRRAPGEPCFGVQLAGTSPDEMAWAAALVEARGADFVDINLGCPIDHFTRKGLGAALARRPQRVRQIVEAMSRALAHAPVTVKIRLGWNDKDRNFLDVARAAVDGGAQAVFVHGRTRDARYRLPSDWEAVGEVVRAVPAAVVGNGDVLFPHDVARGIGQSGCVGVMSARGVLIKPWLFAEHAAGEDFDYSADQRLALYRRYVALATEHWGDDEHGRERVREFTRWHLGFWCRYVPRRADGTYPRMQEREERPFARTPLEGLLARGDDVALDWLADALVDGGPIEPGAVPPPADGAGRDTPRDRGVEARG